MPPRKSQDSSPTHARFFGDHRPPASALKLLLFVAAFWLLMSGHYTPLLLSLGALSVFLVVWVTFRMRIVDEESLPLRLLPGLPRFLVWLGGQVALSAIAVLRLVWSPRRRPRPAVGTVTADDLSDSAKVVYANSITLTPGTLSLELTDEDIEVHSVDQRNIEELRRGAMLDRVRRLEKR